MAEMGTKEANKKLENRIKNIYRTELIKLDARDRLRKKLKERNPTTTSWRRNSPTPGHSP